MTTTNLVMTLPTVGASSDTWGDTLNADLNIIDALFKSDGTGTAIGANTTGNTLAADQIKFPATQRASSDANTLDDYEEGTWTPIDSSGASLSFSSVHGSYTKIGNTVRIYGTFVFPVTANGSNAIIGGLPFTAANIGTAFPITCLATGGGAVAVTGLITKNTTTIVIAGVAGTAQTNADNSGRTIYLSGVYSV